MDNIQYILKYFEEDKRNKSKLVQRKMYMVSVLPYVFLRCGHLSIFSLIRMSVFEVVVK